MVEGRVDGERVVTADGTRDGIRVIKIGAKVSPGVGIAVVVRAVGD